MESGSIEQTTRFYTVGKQLKRTFIAFILSYFIVFLQVWLGIELFKLAQELERAGRNQGIEAFRKSSKLFLGARAAAFAAFIMGLVAIVVAFVNPYAIYSYYGYYDFILMMPIILVIPIIIELGILSSAWKYLYRFFELDASPSTQSRSLGLKSTARVRWALGFTIASTVIRVFTSATSSYNYYDYYPGYSSSIYLMPTFLSLAGGLLLLLGTINAGVGMYDTSRAFLTYQEIYEKRPRPERLPDRDLRIRSAYDAYRELPFHPENLASRTVSTRQSGDAPVSENYYAEVPLQQRKGKYCFNCGTELPEVTGLRFCPNCGIRVN